MINLVVATNVVKEVRTLTPSLKEILIELSLHCSTYLDSCILLATLAINFAAFFQS